MKTNIFRMLVLCFSVLVMLFFSSIALAVECSKCSNNSSLSSKEAIECGTSCASGTNQTPAQATSDINQTIKTIINVLSVLVGVVAVIMIVLGGFRYVTSGGKQESVTAAKNTILYAVIGLIIVALAQIIVRFVLVHATGTKTSG